MARDYIVSDCHLGAGGVNDDFKPYQARFNRFLTLVGKDRLVIAGDLIGCWKNDLGDIVRAYKPLISRLIDMGAIILPGNHDSLLLGFSQLYPWAMNISEEFELGDFRILHGHQFDAVNSGRGCWGRASELVLGTVEQYRWGRWANHTLSRMTWRARDYGIARAARQGIRTIIAGHTHHARQDVRYINVGYWCGPVANYAVVEDGVATLHQFEGPQ